MRRRQNTFATQLRALLRASFPSGEPSLFPLKDETGTLSPALTDHSQWTTLVQRWLIGTLCTPYENEPVRTFMLEEESKIMSLSDIWRQYIFTKPKPNDSTMPWPRIPLTSMKKDHALTPRLKIHHLLHRGNNCYIFKATVTLNDGRDGKDDDCISCIVKASRLFSPNLVRHNAERLIVDLIKANRWKQREHCQRLAQSLLHSEDMYLRIGDDDGVFLLHPRYMLSDMLRCSEKGHLHLATPWTEAIVWATVYPHLFYGHFNVMDEKSGAIYSLLVLHEFGPSLMDHMKSMIMMMGKEKGPAHPADMLHAYIAQILLVVLEPVKRAFKLCHNDFKSNNVVSTYVKYAFVYVCLVWADKKRTWLRIPTFGLRYHLIDFGFCHITMPSSSLSIMANSLRHDLPFGMMPDNLYTDVAQIGYSLLRQLLRQCETTVAQHVLRWRCHHYLPGDVRYRNPDNDLLPQVKQHEVYFGKDKQTYVRLCRTSFYNHCYRHCRARNVLRLKKNEQHLHVPQPWRWFFRVLALGLLGDPITTHTTEEDHDDNNIISLPRLGTWDVVDTSWQAVLSLLALMASDDDGRLLPMDTNKWNDAMYADVSHSVTARLKWSLLLPLLIQRYHVDESEVPAAYYRDDPQEETYDDLGVPMFAQIYFPYKEG
jgi:hypothetical protein